MSFDCAFCGQSTGTPQQNDILALIDEAWAVRPVLAELGAAVAMPSVGALTPGHTLVCPTKHHRSLLATPEDAAADVQSLVNRVRARLEYATGLPTHVFEHGSSRHGKRVACSVEHAHVHILPCEVDVRSTVSKIVRWQPAGNNLDDLRRVVGDSEYLLYEAPTGERLAAATEIGLPSQLLRKVFAAALDVEQWDWHLDPAVERIAATAELFGVCVTA